MPEQFQLSLIFRCPNVAWSDRFNPDEISALQHAMNLKFRNEAAFFAEYQNEPVTDEVDEEILTSDEIAQKTNGYRCGVVPVGSSYLTMFIDIHQSALYWLIVAWEDNFSGAIIDYGTYPDQRREYFTLRDIQNTLMLVTAGAGLEAAIYAGLEKLTAERLGSVYYRDDGVEMRIGCCLIDANWGQTTDVVYQFCRQSVYANILYPSHGQYVGASSNPFSTHKRQRGDRVGRHWRIPGSVGNRTVRHVFF